MNTLLHYALLLLVSSWSVPIGFCNHLSNFAFLITKNYGQSFFLYFLLHFHCTPCMGLRCVVNVLLICMFFLYLSHSLLDLMKLLIPFTYASSTCPAIFKLKLPYKLTLEGTLHSRVNNFTTDNSIVIFSSNSKSKLIS